MTTVGSTATLPAPSPALMARRVRPLEHRPPRSLSAARMSVVQQCHRLYGFRYLDHLDEVKSPESARGALLHKALEIMFSWPAAQRTLDAVVEHLVRAWEALVADEPEYLEHYPSGTVERREMFAEVEARLATYFGVEDPTVLLNTLQEIPFDVVHDGVPLIGVIDRIDVHPSTGAERITDYKAGRPPSPRHAEDRLVQVKVYALARYIQTGRLPALVRIMFLGGDGHDAAQRIVEWVPTMSGLRILAARLNWAWATVNAVHRDNDRTPTPQTLCAWCPFAERCPEGQEAAEAYWKARAERENSQAVPQETS